ncbi:MAG: GNAT family N-acetyltransferase [Pseudomonadota bacterium]
MTIRKLNNDDRAETEAFLSRHAESSMFLLSNSRRSGFLYDDKPFHADYYASVASCGAIDGVLAHCWNGNIILQAPEPGALNTIIGIFSEEVTRPIAGVLGPGSQATPAITMLGLDDASYSINVNDGLFSLDLDKLLRPSGLADPDLKVVRAADCEPALIGRWLKGFEIEALGKDDDEALDKAIESRTANLEKWPDLWVMEISGTPVAMSGFSARLTDMVQVGAVWTPPEHRGQQFARTVVAATLSRAKAEGVERAVLFANSPAAIRSYEAIGFRRIDSYQIAMLKRPIHLK